ncbi:MAG: hypothetical protein ACM3S1_11360 [Hyphomicrobiales bacterium]
MNTKAVIAGVAGTAAASAIAVTTMRRGSSTDGTGAEQRMSELRRHLSDMIALDTEVLNAVRRQLKSSQLDSYPEALAIAEEIERTLESHLEKLDEELEAMGGASQSALKSVAAGAIGMTALVIDRLRTEPVSRMIRDDYVALSLVAISYSMLHTTALSMGAQTLADAAQLCLEQTTPLVVRISDEMPRIVALELERSQVPMQPEAGEAGEEHAHEAWQQGAQQEHQGF